MKQRTETKHSKQRRLPSENQPPLNTSVNVEWLSLQPCLWPEGRRRGLTEVGRAGRPLAPPQLEEALPEGGPPLPRAEAVVSRGPQGARQRGGPSCGGLLRQLAHLLVGLVLGRTRDHRQSGCVRRCTGYNGISHCWS